MNPKHACVVTFDDIFQNPPPSSQIGVLSWSDKQKLTES